jgi:hypothetical protein
MILCLLKSRVQSTSAQFNSDITEPLEYSQIITHQLHGAESFLNNSSPAVTKAIPASFVETTDWLPRHKSPPLVSVLSHTNPVHTLTFNSLNINFNVALTSVPKCLAWFLPFTFYTNILCAFLVSKRATCAAHLILLYFITLLHIMKLLGMSVQFSPASRYILPRVLCSRTSSMHIISSLNVPGEVSHLYKSTGAAVLTFICI